MANGKMITYIILDVVAFLLLLTGILLIAFRHTTENGVKKVSQAKLWTGIIFLILGIVGLAIFTWLAIRNRKNVQTTNF